MDTNPKQPALYCVSPGEDEDSYQFSQLTSEGTSNIPIFIMAPGINGSHTLVFHANETQQVSDIENFILDKTHIPIHKQINTYSNKILSNPTMFLKDLDKLLARDATIHCRIRCSPDNICTICGSSQHWANWHGSTTNLSCNNSMIDIDKESDKSSDNKLPSWMYINKAAAEAEKSLYGKSKKLTVTNKPLLKDTTNFLTVPSSFGSIKGPVIIPVQFDSIKEQYNQLLMSDNLQLTPPLFKCPEAIYDINEKNVEYDIPEQSKVLYFNIKNHIELLGKNITIYNKLAHDIKLKQTILHDTIKTHKKDLTKKTQVIDTMESKIKYLRNILKHKNKIINNYQKLLKL